MQCLLYLFAVTDPPPTDNNVRAGWGALFLLLGIIAVMIFLFFSFSKQLRKVKAANEAGVYGDHEAEQKPEQTRGGTTGASERNPEQYGS